MNAALYFPHTSIRSPALLREALLLWDRVETIVPWEDWEPNRELPPIYVKAQELLVSSRVPTDEEKLGVHKAVDALIKKGLPQWLIDTTDHPADFDLTQSYGIYGQKFLPETWKMLEEAALAKLRLMGRRDYDVPRGVGLLLLAALAEECAGQQHQRITDQQAAYSCLTGWLAARLGGGTPIGEDTVDLEGERQRLISVCVSQVSAEGVPIDRLVALREEEARRPGAGLSEFRANYRQRLDECLNTLSSASKHEGDYNEILASFEQAMASDLANLKLELGLAKAKLLFNRDLVVALVVGTGLILPALPSALQVPAVGVAGLVGIASGYVDYLAARRKVLLGRAMSWLYLAKNG